MNPRTNSFYGTLPREFLGKYLVRYDDGIEQTTEKVRSASEDVPSIDVGTVDDEAQSVEDQRTPEEQQSVEEQQSAEEQRRGV